MGTNLVDVEKGALLLPGKLLIFTIVPVSVVKSIHLYRYQWREIIQSILSPSVQPIGQALYEVSGQNSALVSDKCEQVWRLVLSRVLKLVS